MDHHNAAIPQSLEWEMLSVLECQQFEEEQAMEEEEQHHQTQAKQGEPLYVGERPWFDGGILEAGDMLVLATGTGLESGWRRTLLSYHGNDEEGKYVFSDGPHKLLYSKDTTNFILASRGLVNFIKIQENKTHAMGIISALDKKYPKKWNLYDENVHGNHDSGEISVKYVDASKVVQDQSGGTCFAHAAATAIGAAESPIVGLQLEPHEISSAKGETIRHNDAKVKHRTSREGEDGIEICRHMAPLSLPVNSRSTDPHTAPTTGGEHHTATSYQGTVRALLGNMRTTLGDQHTATVNRGAFGEISDALGNMPTTAGGHHAATANQRAFRELSDTLGNMPRTLRARTRQGTRQELLNRNLWCDTEEQNDQVETSSGSAGSTISTGASLSQPDPLGGSPTCTGNDTEGLDGQVETSSGPACSTISTGATLSQPGPATVGESFTKTDNDTEGQDGQLETSSGAAGSTMSTGAFLPQPDPATVGESSTATSKKRAFRELSDTTGNMPTTLRTRTRQATRTRQPTRRLGHWRDTEGQGGKGETSSSSPTDPTVSTEAILPQPDPSSAAVGGSSRAPGKKRAFRELSDTLGKMPTTLGTRTRQATRHKGRWRETKGADGQGEVSSSSPADVPMSSTEATVPQPEPAPATVGERARATGSEPVLSNFA